MSPKQMGGSFRKLRDSTGSSCTLDLIPISVNGLYESEHSSGSSLIECCARYWSELLSMALKAGTWPLKLPGVKEAGFSGENTWASSPRPDAIAKQACSSNKSRRAVSWGKTKHSSWIALHCVSQTISQQGEFILLSHHLALLVMSHRKTISSQQRTLLIWLRAKCTKCTFITAVFKSLLEQDLIQIKERSPLAGQNTPKWV